MYHKGFQGRVCISSSGRCVFDQGKSRGRGGWTGLDEGSSAIRSLYTRPRTPSTRRGQAHPRQHRTAPRTYSLANAEKAERKASRPSGTGGEIAGAQARVPDNIDLGLTNGKSRSRRSSSVPTRHKSPGRASSPPCGQPCFCTCKVQLGRRSSCMLACSPCFRSARHSISRAAEARRWSASPTELPSPSPMQIWTRRRHASMTGLEALTACSGRQLSTPAPERRQPIRSGTPGIQDGEEAWISGSDHKGKYHHLVQVTRMICLHGSRCVMT